MPLPLDFELDFEFEFEFILTTLCSWRGALRVIMTTPYLLKDSYELGVWKRNGVVYLQTRKSDPRQFHDMDEQQQRFMYYGYKFEDVCTCLSALKETSDDGGIQDQRGVDPAICYGGVFKSKVGATRVLFGAEIDCVDRRTNEHVELKVTKQVKTERDRFTFERYKLLKWYAQSFLAGTTKLVVGYRDGDGMLHQVETFDTLKLPRIVRGREDRLWCASRALLFLDTVLQWLRASVPEDDGMYKVVYSAQTRHLALEKCSRMAFEEIDEELYF